MPDELDDVVRDFLVESHENLDQLDRDLVALEQDPTAAPLLASIFRTIHTIKGTCGFLGFGKLEAVTHAGESLLARLRDGELVLDAEITTALLALVDAVRSVLRAIEATGAEGVEDYGALIETLQRLQHGRRDVPSAAEPAPAPAASADPDGRHGVAETSIRVDVGLLDRLMNLAGELVLARNQIVQCGTTHTDPVLLAASQRLSLVTSELQSDIMKTRMQPIDTLWSKLPRVVRDLAVTCGRQVRLEMEGRETELDKTIIEAIKDPLTHLVRNAVDHGVEPAAARVAAGKPAEGRIVLRAFHEGGQVNIEIADDGAGLRVDRIRERAVARGLVTADQAARMSDREAAQLIFLPGFSTAEQVTSISGRGVGMDVVKTNVEKIGGTVDVVSVPGHGTTFKVKIPLTLAIIPALVVTAGGERFAIPQVSLVELVRIEAARRAGAIEHVGDAPVYRLRGQLLPLVFLDAALGLESAAPAAERAVNVVVLHADERQFGLVVDEVTDTEEIVVKPLGKHLAALDAFAGATIMGDGRVALILDVLGLARRAGVVTGDRGRTVVDAEAGDAPPTGRREPMLVFALRGGRRMAMPLALVARLEELPRAAVERSGGREVLQYRGGILPLVHLADVLGVPADGAEPPATMPVVVHDDGTRSVGLVVARILDVVDEEIAVREGGGAPGIAGSVVLQGRVTDLLDVQAVLPRAVAEAA